ncbi:MAG: hypothetical protein SVY53_13730 [Chloroflexota bacterium]|nr:hypothetical protein [Chloroflexota bacterium]
MKYNKLICISSLVLALLLSGGACIVNSGGNGEATEAIEIMKIMPQNSQDFFMFIDMDLIEEQEDSEELASDFNEVLSWYADICGFETDDVDRFATGGVLVFEGDFDFDEVRAQLEESEYSQGEYNGVEIWTGTGLWEGIVVAIVSGRIITADTDSVEACIDVIEDGESSVYDSEDAKDVMDRLPRGMMVGYGQEATLSGASDYEGLVSSGVALTEQSGSRVKGYTVMKFENAEAAEDAEQTIEDDLKASESNFQNIEVTRDGKFVDVVMEQEIEDYASDGV